MVVILLLAFREPEMVLVTQRPQSKQHMILGSGLLDTDMTKANARVQSQLDNDYFWNIKCNLNLRSRSPSKHNSPVKQCESKVQFVPESTEQKTTFKPISSTPLPKHTDFEATAEGTLLKTYRDIFNMTNQSLVWPLSDQYFDENAALIWSNFHYISLYLFNKWKVELDPDSITVTENPPIRDIETPKVRPLKQ